MKIAVVGIGYVGLSNAILLSQNNPVTLLDIDKSKVDLINSKKSPIVEKTITSYLKNKNLDLIATNDSSSAFQDKDFIIIATPTNFDLDTNKFDTSIVDLVIREAHLKNPKAMIIIKSTVPVGYTDAISTELDTSKIVFSPEFLREGSSLEDNLYPSRIIIGQSSKQARKFANLLIEAADKKGIEVLFTGNKEAESIKLFSNTYLAMRVAFFNELDNYAIANNLETKSIIDGVSADPRIGNFYNNPSFGYGGYCLPKDTKQLLSNFQDIPQNLIHATIQSNKTRINFIAKKIISLNAKKIGVYRLIMKADSDNWRESALLHLINVLKSYELEIFVYEPLMQNKNLDSSLKFVDTIESLESNVDLILTNRLDEKITKYKSKIFTRDLYGNN
jgi:UDPglucose 6-dehydrogenase